MQKLLKNLKIFKKISMRKNNNKLLKLEKIYE